MHSTVERVGIVYKEIHGSNSLDGISVRHRLLHDQTGGAAVEVISVLQHVEERPSGLRGFLQDHAHARAVAAGV